MGPGLIREWLGGIGAIAIFCREIISSLSHARLAFGDLVYQIFFVGVKSQSVVLITGAFTGLVLCAQTYFQFHKFKADPATLAVVSVGMASELGPVLTALMVAGRVGAAIAAELGTMRVTEQIDALRTLAAHPIDYLVLPRTLATVIALPLLTAEAVALGILAAFGLGVLVFDIDFGNAFWNMLRYTGAGDFLRGFIKAGVFGAVIAVVGCYKGMNCPQGAEGVGKATTEAVVYSSIAILIGNFALTMILTKLFS